MKFGTNAQDRQRKRKRGELRGLGQGRDSTRWGRERKDDDQEEKRVLVRDADVRDLRDGKKRRGSCSFPSAGHRKDKQHNDVHASRSEAPWCGSKKLGAASARPGTQGQSVRDQMRDRERSGERSVTHIGRSA